MHIRSMVLIECIQAKAIKPKTRNHKLRNDVNWQAGLKKKGRKTNGPETPAGCKVNGFCLTLLPHV
jgi:hypothetical protein